MNSRQQQEAPGQITVTQTDMLAQIGALTLENTVLKNQLAQAQSNVLRLLSAAEKAGVAVSVDELEGVERHEVMRNPMPPEDYPTPD